MTLTITTMVVMALGIAYARQSVNYIKGDHNESLK
jgi:hypothetical protein